MASLLIDVVDISSDNSYICRLTQFVHVFGGERGAG